VADLQVLSKLITDACAAMKVQVQLALKAIWEVPDISDLFSQHANQPNAPAKETS